MTHWEDDEQFERDIAQSIRGPWLSEMVFEHLTANRKALVERSWRSRWVHVLMPLLLVLYVGSSFFIKADGWVGVLATVILAFGAGLGASRSISLASAYRSGYLDRAKRDLLDLELSDPDPVSLREFRMRQTMHNGEILFGVHLDILDKRDEDDG